jgi:hypothetical protein
MSTATPFIEGIRVMVMAADADRATHYLDAEGEAQPVDDR